VIVRHIRLSKIKNLTLSDAGDQYVSPCQISSKSVEWLQRWQFNGFQNGDHPPLGFLKVVKISKTVAEISQFLMFRMAATAVLDFQNSKI